MNCSVLRGGTVADSPSRVADQLAELLEEAGVEVVFGLPGGPISPLNDALLDVSIRRVTTKHENGAMYAAAGYARATGKVGVVLVTSGPGVLNGMCGLGSAYCDGVPLLVLVGDVARNLQGRGVFQDGSAHHLDIRAVTRSVSKRTIEVPDGRAAAAMLTRALQTAADGPAGPVVLILPMDVLTTTAPRARISLASPGQQTLSVANMGPAIDSLAQASSGAIFSGSGCNTGDGPVLLRRLAEALQWPVMTTPRAKGVFPEDHPLALGVLGIGGHPSAARFLKEPVDVLLSLGSSLGDLSTNGWSPLLKPEVSFIQVDLDANRVSSNYEVTHLVEASVEVFVQHALSLLPRRSRARRFGIETWVDASVETDGPGGQISTGRAVWEIQQAMPEDTVFAVDSGEHFFSATHYLRMNRPNAFLVQTGLGAMGSGICGGLGYALGASSTPVAVICGDGGFLMVGTELATAVEHGLAPVIFVMNDARLGMVEFGHKALFGRTPSFSTGEVDLPTLARSLGADAAVAVHTGDILALDLRSPRVRPLVVDVRIDRMVQMPKNQRFDTLSDIASNSEVEP